MQGRTATIRHGVKRKRNTKRLRDTGNLLNSNYLAFSIGEFFDCWFVLLSQSLEEIFKPLNFINCGIGRDRMQNVLWQSNNLPSSPFSQNPVILHGTNNIQ